MIIRKSRIRSLLPYVRGLEDGEDFSFGVSAAREVVAMLPELGFSNPWVDGESLLPSASMGPACKRNAEGWTITHRNRPKETVSHPIEWRWKEWHGRERVSRTGIVFRSYRRYPRTSVRPPALEIATVETPQGRMVVLDRRFQKGPDNRLATIGVNVLLELFSEAELLRDDLTSTVPQQLTRVNWEVLPQGRQPWAELEPVVQQVLDVQGPRKRPVFEHRWSTIAAFGPDFTAVGRAGFSGYLIFAFEDRSLYILESATYGNATYVLSRDWEALSSMTKAELLDRDLHQDRIVHTEDWERRIRSLLGPAPKSAHR